MIASNELIEKLDRLDQKELIWLSGYCWAKAGQSNPISVQETVANALLVPSNHARSILILSASQTGNAKRVAEQLHQQLQGLSASVQWQHVGDYKAKNLVQEDIVILVSSTQGEGEFPEEAISFAKFLFGKKAPNLNQLTFAVLGLGDSSYPLFCEASKQFDERFAALGAQRLLPRFDGDVDYENQVATWLNKLNTHIEEACVQTTDGATTQPAMAHSQPITASVYTKNAPYSATLLARQQITARHAEKNVQHLEIDLADSGIQYEAGDALGVYVNNSAALINDFLTILQLDGATVVQNKAQQESTLKQVLTEDLELTQNSASLVKKWAEISQSAALTALVADSEALQNYAQLTPLLAMVTQYPARLTAQQWIEFLRPLTPRMYSIASAQDEVGDEVHLTLGVVQYEFNEKTYTGAASHYLTFDREEDDAVRIFVEANPRFRLPTDPATALIMIGAGTGIAPFRAFMQQREAQSASGKAWLIFGNQRFTADFLYQSEWQRWHKLGLLHNTDFAWSRQNPAKKVYVQHKVLEQGAELWRWLEQGAHLYICGDANYMARAVEQALLEVIQQHGALDSEAAEDYLDQLRDDRRYQRDVY